MVWQSGELRDRLYAQHEHSVGTEGSEKRRSGLSVVAGAHRGGTAYQDGAPGREECSGAAKHRTLRIAAQSRDDRHLETPAKAQGKFPSVSPFCTAPAR